MTFVCLTAQRGKRKGLAGGWGGRSARPDGEMSKESLRAYHHQLLNLCLRLAAMVGTGGFDNR
jgi:hypothetical protein